MKQLSDSVSAIPASSIRKMFNLAQKTENVVSFALGEPDYATPQNIMEAAVRAMEQGQTHYTPNVGIPALCRAVAKTVEKKKKLRYDPEGEIMITAGGVEALFLSMRVILNPGDEVLLGDPYFPNYIGQIEMSGGVPKPLRLLEEDGFRMNPDSLCGAIGPRTKILILNFPANPTGAVADAENLRQIAKVAVEHDLYVITDEVYQDFVYDDAPFVSIASFPGMRERTVIVDSFSKTYAMTGWRVGFAAGPRDILQNMIKIQENVISCVNAPAQYAALEALTGSQSGVSAMVQDYRQRRDLLLEGIRAIPGLSCQKPSGAFYAFVNIRQTGMTSEEFSIRLLNETGVVVVPGSGFGAAGEGYVRISYVVSRETIAEGLRRMAAFTHRVMARKEYTGKEK